MSEFELGILRQRAQEAYRQKVLRGEVLTIVPIGFVRSHSNRADAHIIVDTGSSAFVPLVHYVVTNEVPSILSQGGHQLVVHTIVTGGQALVDTLHGAAQLSPRC